MILTKPGVRFFDPILNALQIESELRGCDFVITSGTDGAHSGPNDPHHLGRAYDIRSQNFDFKDKALYFIMVAFDDGPVTSKDGGLITEHYFGWLENAGTPNEHFHVQLRKGVSYP